MTRPPDAGPNPPSEPRPDSSPAIDLEALAERVYRLLREDLRLERAREGRERGR
ncbi:hypothetical protein Mterra_03709 [Calidithermus terrae]|uniref:Uncharacterized protein n=1 Tax=Calidithermus terrae TaxID=1408545 RepID=A0A399E5D4_9DEIN|nr:hypothetical protein [Calidithermus terrae]RIH77960.1 hypothetical protein Mterra_03709 [Calidithermus terrae]